MYVRVEEWNEVWVYAIILQIGDHRFRSLPRPPDLVPLIDLAVQHGSGHAVFDQPVHRVRAIQLVFLYKIAAITKKKAARAEREAMSG